MTVLEGVSTFFSWLYSTVNKTWDIVSLLITFLLFLAIQGFFIFIYIKFWKTVFEMKPVIQRLKRRLDEF